MFWWARPARPALLVGTILVLMQAGSFHKAVSKSQAQANHTKQHHYNAYCLSMKPSENLGVLWRMHGLHQGSRLNVTWACEFPGIYDRDRAAKPVLDPWSLKGPSIVVALSTASSKITVRGSANGNNRISRGTVKPPCSKPTLAFHDRRSILCRRRYGDISPWCFVRFCAHPPDSVVHTCYAMDCFEACDDVSVQSNTSIHTSHMIKVLGHAESHRWLGCMLCGCPGQDS